MARTVLPSVANRLPTDVEELGNMARALEDLQRHPGWSILQDLTEQAVAELDARLDRGDVPLEQAEYSMLHGKRGALTFSKDAVATVIEKSREREKAELDRQPVAATNGR